MSRNEGGGRLRREASASALGRWRSFLVGPGATVLVLVAAGGRGAAAQDLAIGLSGTAMTERVAATELETLVEALSAGAIEVEIHEGRRSCGDAASCRQALRAGRIDVWPASVRDLVPWFPELDLLELPYLFESDQVIERVFDGPFAARLDAAVADRTGFRLMGLELAAGWRTFATTGRPVRKPEDLEGLTLWTAGSDMEAELVEALGGSTATLPAADLQAALVAGRVHGITSPVTEIVQTGLHQRLRSLTLDRHAPALTLWLMNETAYRALSPVLQPVLRAAFDEMTRQRRARAEERLAAALRRFRAAGVEVHVSTPDERTAFLMAAGRVALAYMDEHGADWLVWLEAAIAQAESEVGAGPW